ncbi:hypothetical protein [Priestia aryabhattai]|uniref:hypothetical protein n=1 Tax=Priestia aryabhattai TaxID=412384 RepID=UPI001FB1CE41|nr:hypothetical protein [Priestia aryabhattai]
MKNARNLRILFKEIFIKLDNFIRWFYKENRLGFTYLLTILLVVFVISISFILLVNTVENKYSMIPLLILSMVFLFFMLITLLNRPFERMQKITGGNARNFKELFNTFTHRAYLIGITIFSFEFAILFITIISLPLDLFTDYHLEIIITNAIFSVSTLFTVCYFMYHVVINKLSVKQVRARVHLYVAWSVTISLIFFILDFKNIFYPMITWLGVGFSWLSYLLSRIDAEDEETK